MIKYILFFVNLFAICNISFIECSDPVIKVTGARFSSRFPLGYTDSDYIMNGSYDVYHSGSLTQYRITIHVDSTENGARKQSPDIYEYFVFDKDSSFGINYKGYTDNIRSQQVARIRVDSATMGYNDASKLYEDEKDKKADSSFWTNDHQLVNVFECKKIDSLHEDVSYFYYYSPNFKDVLETLNRKFDTAAGLKVYKIIGHAHGTYYEKTKKATQERRFIWEIQRPSSEEIEIANSYFLKYKKHFAKIGSR